MKNLKRRLGQANGMNARLCWLARDEINRLEKIINICHQAALPDPQDERPIDVDWLVKTILEATKNDVKGKRWDHMESMRK